MAKSINSDDALSSHNQLREVFDQAPALIAILRGPNHVFDLANDAYLKVVAGKRGLIGRSVAEALPEVVEQGFIKLLDSVYSSGQAYVGNEIKINLARHGDDSTDEAYFNFVYQPLRDNKKQVSGIFVHAVEVTEQVRNKLTLATSEERLELALEASQMGMWDWNIETGSLVWSEQLQRVYGLNPGVFRGNYDHYQSLLHPDDIPQMRRIIDQAVKEHKTYQCEHRIIWPDGTVHWVMGMGRAFYRDGKAIRMAGTTLGIDLRKHLDAEAAAGEQRLLEMADHLPNLAWLARADGYIYWYNHRWYDYTGKSEAEMEGWGWQSVHDPAVLPRVMKAWQASISSGIEFDMTFPLKGADGGFRQFLTRVTPLKDGHGQVEGWLGTNTDITVQKETEEMLRERARLSDLAGDISGALIGSDSLPDILQNCTQALVDHLGAAFARIWVFDETENLLVLRASAGMYTHLDGDHARVPMGQLKIGAIAQTRQPVLTNNVIGDRRVNHQAWAIREQMVAFAGYPLIVEDQLMGVMALFSKQALSKETLTMMASVANGVALGIKRKELDHQKDAFIGLASHELKTPVTSMKLNAQMLQRGFTRRGDTDSAAKMQSLDSQLNKMTALINDLLDITMIESGSLSINPTAFDYDALVREAIEEVQIASEEHLITLEGGCGVVIGDRGRLHQVLNNLLTNAIKYSPGQSKVEVHLKRVKGMAVTTVKDFGIGMSPSLQKRIFERFYRASGGGRESVSGLGLGLYISSKIIKRHRGHIKVESRENQGSAFSFTLPLTDNNQIKG